MLIGNSPSKILEYKPKVQDRMKPIKFFGVGVSDPQQLYIAEDDDEPQEGLPSLIENNANAQKRATISHLQ